MSSAHSWLATVSDTRGEPLRTQFLRVFRFRHKPASRYTLYSRCSSLALLRVQPTPAIGDCHTRLLSGQPHQPLLQPFIRSRGTVTKAAHRGRQQPSHPTVSGRELFPPPAGIRPSVYELGPFFAITAFSISRSRLRSATSRFQMTVLVLQHSQPSAFRGIHAAELRLPVVNRVFRRAALTGHILGRTSGLPLLQRSYDLRLTVFDDHTCSRTILHRRTFPDCCRRVNTIRTDSKIRGISECPRSNRNRKIERALLLECSSASVDGQVGESLLSQMI
jgi:hypothetical protein